MVKLDKSGRMKEKETENAATTTKTGNVTGCLHNITVQGILLNHR